MFSKRKEPKLSVDFDHRQKPVLNELEDTCFSGSPRPFGPRDDAGASSLRAKRGNPELFIQGEPTLNTDNKKWSIVIQDLLISCRIGVYPKEQDVYQDVLINLECDYYAPLPTHTNTDVSQVLCYDSLSQEIQAIAQRSHIYFLESFAETIADYCLKDPRTRTVKLSIMKLNALDNAKSAGIKITRRSYVPKVRGLSV